MEITARMNFVIIVAAVLGHLSAEDISCLDLIHCNLIRGDMAKFIAKFNNDSSKFYKEAEVGVQLYQRYIKSPDSSDSVKQECNQLLESCDIVATKMAVEHLKFPESYNDSCNYESFSRSIFNCKNILDWPPAIKVLLPPEFKTCEMFCGIDDEQKYALATGIVMSMENSGSPPTGMPEIDDLALEQRVTGIDRRVLYEISAFENDVNQTGWGTLEACQKASFVQGIDRIEKGDYLAYVEFQCSHYYRNNGKSRIRGGIPAVKPTVQPGYTKRYNKYCKLGSTKTFIVGISVNTKQFRTYGRIPLYVNFVCAHTDTWNYPRESTAPVVTDVVPDSIEMWCPSLTAVCAIQTRFATFENITFVTDIRIGCCIGVYTGLSTLTGRKKYRYLPPVTPPVTTIPPGLPTVTPLTGISKVELGIYTLQTNFLLFWAGVLSHHITRYNYMYSPHTIDKETEWVTTTCREGTFLSGFEVTNPVSNYYWTRRIIVIKFRCAAVDGSKANQIELYTKLKAGEFTLLDSDLSQKGDCGRGYYTAMNITYYLDKLRQALVHGWGVAMTCTRGVSIETHEHIVNSSPRNKISDNTPKSGAADCGMGKAICGFSNSVIQNRRGSFEGLYYKINCCNV